MNVKESIEMRRSIRAFKKESVSPEILQEIFQTAWRAPSWGNTQPWKCTVVGGEILQAIIEESVVRILKGENPQPDVEMPRDWPVEFTRRYKENGRKLFALLGIGREDQERRKTHRLEMFRFFGAPQAIYLHQHRDLGHYSLFDAGLLAENIALLAVEKSLGTCILGVTVLFPEVIRRHTGIPDSEKFIIGIAIGYPDWEAPINHFQSEREPIESMVRWAE